MKENKEIEKYLSDLGAALKVSDWQKEKILAEVRSDIESMVEKFELDGKGDRSVSLALDEFGNPYEMAHHMKKEVPPHDGMGLSVVRYILAGIAMLWTIIFLWNIRPWNYGFSWGSPLIGLMHIPFVLLLWPRIIWRKNWLYGVIPPVIALIAFWLIAFSGQKSETTVGAFETNAAGELIVVEPVIEIQNGGAISSNEQMIFTLILLSILVALILAMQQSKQRWIVSVSVVLLFGIIEIAYYAEEMRFKEDLENVKIYVASQVEQNGQYPGELDLADTVPNLNNKSALYRSTESGYTLFWPRPLSRGNSIYYSSESDTIDVQD